MTLASWLIVPRTAVETIDGMVGIGICIGMLVLRKDARQTKDYALPVVEYNG